MASTASIVARCMPLMGGFRSGSGGPSASIRSLHRVAFLAVQRLRVRTDRPYHLQLLEDLEAFGVEGHQRSYHGTFPQLLRGFAGRSTSKHFIRDLCFRVSLDAPLEEEELPGAPHLPP